VARTLIGAGFTASALTGGLAAWRERYPVEIDEAAA
jgi:rhodanese-related sulfurtransferase